MKDQRSSSKKGNQILAGFRKWDLDCFHRGYTENLKFWSRLGGEPCFKGLKVLEIGCGHGSLCVDMATRGAKKVIGIDIKEQLVQFDKKYTAKFFPQLKNKIDFYCCRASDVNENDFDVIVSKDTFEHLINLENELIEMKKRLKKGGKIYVGFGPLFHSCYGGHRRTKIPWGHLIVPESVLIRMRPHCRLNLNKLSLKQYLLHFKKSGFLVSYFRVNANMLARGHEKAMLQLFSLLHRILPFKKFFSANLYCILEIKG